MDAAADLFDGFDELLAEEREAIRLLDGKKVEAIAKSKVARMQQIVALSPAERATHVQRLSALSLSLRRNGVLLVHARGILRDALRIKGAQLNEVGSFARIGANVAAVQMSRPRLSVRG